MSSEIFGLILDVFVLIFLGAMIFYAMRLSISLNAFRTHRQDFDKIVSSLVGSVAQAERAIAALKETGEKEAGQMQQMIREAKALSEELQIINAAGESMATRLEKLAERNRKIVQGMDPLHTEGDLPAQAEARPSVPQPQKRPQKAAGESVARQAAPPLRAEKLIPERRPVERKLVRRPESAPVSAPVSAPRQTTPASARPQRRATEDDLPSFMIQDRDHAGLEALEEKLEGSASNDYAHESGGGVADEAPDHLQSQAERELYEALRRSGHARRTGGRGG